MAIAEGKKRVMITLTEEQLEKLEYLYDSAKDNRRAFGHFTQSNVVGRLIDNDYEIKKKFV